jgi:hypothetical protein
MRVVDRATSSNHKVYGAGPLNTTHPRPKLVGLKGESGFQALLTPDIAAVVPGMNVSPVMGVPLTHVSSVPEGAVWNSTQVHVLGAG